jgi:hypothetical protein
MQIGQVMGRRRPAGRMRRALQAKRFAIALNVSQTVGELLRGVLCVQHESRQM